MERLKVRVILLDKNLARLGDAFINFVFSLAITEVENCPTGIKVSDKILAEAARKSGLRKILPNRADRGLIANAVEALTVYVWLKRLIMLDESVNILKASIRDPAQAISNLVSEAIERIGHD